MEIELIQYNQWKLVFHWTQVLLKRTNSWVAAENL